MYDLNPFVLRFGAFQEDSRGPRRVQEGMRRSLRLVLHSSMQKVYPSKYKQYVYFCFEGEWERRACRTISKAKRRTGEKKTYSDRIWRRGERADSRRCKIKYLVV